MMLEKKWFQWTNEEITHLHTNNDEESSGNYDESVASDADVRVASCRSGSSATKSGLGGLQKFQTQLKSEISEG